MTIPNNIHFPIGAFNNKKSPQKDDFRNTNDKKDINPQSPSPK